MKPKRKSFYVVSVIFLFAFVATPALTSNVVIKFQDGSSVTYDSSKISSITFSESQTSAGGNVLFTEEFAGDIGRVWEPIEVVGGNFKKFARVEYNTLKVVVPENNSWGKTGIMSKTPLFSVDEGMSSNPLKMVFTFDPDNTTGFVIALSREKNPDIWLEQNVWFHWGTPTISEGRAYITNSQNEAVKPGIKTPTTAPKTLSLLVFPGKVEVTLFKGSNLSINISWLKPGVRAYLYVFSSPWRYGERASFALRSIKLMQGN